MRFEIRTSVLLNEFSLKVKKSIREKLVYKFSLILRKHQEVRFKV